MRNRYRCGQIPGHLFLTVQQIRRVDYSAADKLAGQSSLKDNGIRFADAFSENDSKLTIVTCVVGVGAAAQFGTQRIISLGIHIQLINLQ
ncbi:hypothetical protein D3C80_1584860 [compost metagenome]